MEAAAQDFAVRHLWLAEIGFYAAAIVVALTMWLWLRRRVARAGNFLAEIVRALGAPVVLAICGFGGQQIVRTAAEHIPHISLSPGRFAEVLVLVCFFWALLRLAAVMEKQYDRPLNIGGGNIDRGAVQAAFRVARYVIIVVAALTTMETLGFSISGLLAFGGIGGVLVGFAAQKTLSNFFSGMIIFTERPFAIGDWIRCPGTEVEGVVENIGWRMTRLRTFDMRPLYVPNAMFSDNIIENPQRMLNRRIYETMGLRYDDIGKMEAILAEVREMLATHPDVDASQIQMVHFDSYGDSSLNFFVYAMTRTIEWREFHRIKEDVLLRVAAIVRKHGAEFAYPTRTLHIAPNSPPPPAPSPEMSPR